MASGCKTAAQHDGPDCQSVDQGNEQHSRHMAPAYAEQQPRSDQDHDHLNADGQGHTQQLPEAVLPSGQRRGADSSQCPLQAVIHDAVG
ncbi:hypothetical protein D3C81_2097060 [compost metagenome]